MSLRFAVACLLASGLLACAPDPPTREQRYTHWLSAGHSAEVTAYRDYLRRHDLDQVLPMSQLLRSARRWRRCGAEEFVVPPRSEWPSMRSTLELVRELDRAGFLDASQVASAYRDETLNQCEGGSRQSRHRANNALDFRLGTEQPRRRKPVCDWTAHGPACRFGLGFYTGRKVHIDTSGFRTWGSDHTRRSSLCHSVGGGTGR